MKHNKKTENVLFCPLNWGLGHATRIVPIIYKELEKGNSVIIIASGGAFNFLKNEFPDVKCIYFSEFSVKYWNKPFVNLGLALQMPLFFCGIFIEHFRLKKIICKFSINKIISDNRYGMFSSVTKNIIITHQLFIKLPKIFKIFEPFVHLITHIFINKFDECWVPDYENFDKSISKELSHNKKTLSNVKYINPISRFSIFKGHSLCDKLLYPNVLILISGPEPARSVFEKQMYDRFKNTDKKVLMVCGNPKHLLKENFGNIVKVSHLSSDEMFCYLKNSKYIICRSGYSTLMDLHYLNRQAELHPTPGQPEQEYLYKVAFK